MGVIADQAASCRSYAGFLANLDREHFDTLYWSLFAAVILVLFIVSGIYQWAMRYREEHGADGTFSEESFRTRLKIALVSTTFLMLVAVVMVTLEVYALLALQFCDGEDLMSLFWATWTILQMGSAIATLGIVLALVHILCDIKQPTWALALGTPVLVVAGIGHVFTYFLSLFFKSAKVRVRERRLSHSPTRKPVVVPSEEPVSCRHGNGDGDDDRHLGGGENDGRERGRCVEQRVPFGHVHYAPRQAEPV